jgi:hemoglobin
MKTLFTKLGGKDAVNLVVDRFYDRVIKDDRVKHFFVNIEMKKQKAHQTAFLTYVFGGSEKYDGRTMRESHKRLVEEMGLNDEHFDAIAEDLVITLQELGIAQELIDEVASVAASQSHRNDVLNRS